MTEENLIRIIDKLFDVNKNLSKRRTRLETKLKYVIEEVEQDEYDAENPWEDCVEEF